MRDTLNHRVSQPFFFFFFFCSGGRVCSILQLWAKLLLLCRWNVFVTLAVFLVCFEVGLLWFENTLMCTLNISTSVLKEKKILCIFGII